MKVSLLFLVAALLFFLGCLVLAIDTAFAQDASLGAIHGRVLDPAGLPVATANVTLRRPTPGLQFQVATNDDGTFAFGLLEPGDYEITAETTGMSPGPIRKVRVEVGAVADIDLRLSLERTREQITVTESPQLVETQSSEIAQVIDSVAIEDLPLNGRRFNDLALLGIGVTQDPRGLTSSSNGDLAFGGIRGFQSTMLVDGGDNNNSFFAQARGRYRAPYQFSNEVVQEFRVSSNAYGAELGRSGGAVVNVVTKSGNNQWHGSGFYYLRDGTFNAQNAYSDRKPEDRQHQFGATVSGPLKKDKAFFLAGWDQHIFHVPTEVRFVDGTSAVIPAPSDYESTDAALVADAAAQLTAMSGSYRSAMIGNAGFFKIDYNLSPRQFVTLRLNTSRYNGENNVFLDPSSPITTHALSENGVEDVATETANLALTSAYSPKVSSHLRLQFSRDLQTSAPNSNEVRFKIYGVLDGAGRSSILPRTTREHKLHVADTINIEQKRHSWKFGVDVSQAWIFNFFPSLFGGEYIFDNTRVDPFTFAPRTYGMRISPLRAYAHNVPRYYIQNFGTATSHPDTTEYALFGQDSIRLDSRVALNLGLRWDLQKFNTKGLQPNPLWPDSGHVPTDLNNVSPRIGFAWNIAQKHATVLRGGWGRFYTRIPSIYTASVETDNGLAQQHLFLVNSQAADSASFPRYPNPLVDCSPNATACVPTDAIASKLTSEMSAFSRDFQMPYVDQSSLSLERDIGGGFAVAGTYLYVHGQHLIRARDANLPDPVMEEYPIFSADGASFTGNYYLEPSFGTWQTTRTVDCPFVPCLSDTQRPVPQLDSVDVFESAAESIYHGFTLSVRRRMSRGFYFRLGYTYAKAIDNGQDALIAGSPAAVQNSADPNAERGLSSTDQRQRLSVSWVYEPRFFHRDRPVLKTIFNNWKLSSVTTIGSG
ncbi:MAG TPA: TonB-dependent receptor, partial [Terriglobales bacterium]|nr:TonB-dependent receptor [Terriglobales bacterium]